MPWIKCTDTDGDPVHVNMDLAVFVRREGRKTVIEFAGTHLKVRETPEELLEPIDDDAADPAGDGD